MRLSDLFKIAYTNLRRRRTRTLLTVLGVVIGTASIVVMLSLGLGMSDLLLKSYQNSGSLNMINVLNYGSSSQGDHALQLTDESIKSFESIPHVVGTSPALQVSVEAKSGVYSSSYEIIGVSQRFLQEIKLKSGSLPKPNQSTLSIIYGNTVVNTFYKNNDWEHPAKIDPDKDTVFYRFPESSVSQQKSNGNDTSAAVNPLTSKKYLIDTAGVMKGGSDEYSDTSMYCYADIDTFKNFLRKIYKKNLVPNPALNKSGKPFRYYVYDTAYVFVDDMNNVTTVQKAISDQGYTAYSNMEWLEQAKQSMNIIQMVLGGIGAVSLLVAAIGIMNTMMMSIYERTKEIGVMKVLGCDMKDIRNMFLTESAMIGFSGGCFGILISYLISFVINRLAAGSSSDLTMGLNGNISSIPPWLSGIAIVFAIFVGTLSGYFPSVRAMKLSPLQAIRNE